MKAGGGGVAMLWQCQLCEVTCPHYHYHLILTHSTRLQRLLREGSLTALAAMAGMMLKMMNPLGSVPSMPTPGNKEDTELSREERLQQERDKKEEMVRAEKERKQRYFFIVPMVLSRYLWGIFSCG